MQIQPQYRQLSKIIQYFDILLEVCMFERLTKLASIFQKKAQNPLSANPRAPIGEEGFRDMQRQQNQKMIANLAMQDAPSMLQAWNSIDDSLKSQYSEGYFEQALEALIDSQLPSNTVADLAVREWNAGIKNFQNMIGFKNFHNLMQAY